MVKHEYTKAEIEANEKWLASIGFHIREPAPKMPTAYCWQGHAIDDYEWIYNLQKEQWETMCPICKERMARNDNWRK